MLGVIKVRERGATPKNLRKYYTRAAKEAWRDTAIEFHLHYRDKRFTQEHAREANYTRRKGELQPRESKAFRRSYTGRKLRLKGHTRPLEFSGKTRRAIRFYSRLTSTSKGGKVSYAGARVFNFRHPKSQVNMAVEFRRITPSEVVSLADFFNERLDQRLAEADRGGVNT